MFRILKKGELLGVAADLNVQEHEGIFVDFFGVPASTTTSVAKLAIKTDAIILPCFAVWDEAKKRYVLRFEPFIKALKTNDEETETLRLTQNITTIVEKYAREFPEQWMWIHKRWNTRPEGEKGLYS